jgi:hypothetical protein
MFSQQLIFHMGDIYLHITGSINRFVSLLIFILFVPKM